MASTVRAKGLIGKAGAVRKIKPQGLITTAMAFLKKMSKPWEVTGPTASPEFLESQSLALEYRKFAPASHPVRPILENTRPDRIYNIAYYPHDLRRLVVVKEKTVQPVAAMVAAATAAAINKGLLLPMTPGKIWIMGKACHLNDTPGGGYTK
ncbi:hypothetical protein CY35_02G207000 [Sphagnum magellanicum]|jgi:hypothetical protein|nr:hypothetical protein CY35_02G207000 [Sphagnum magellanicum]